MRPCSPPGSAALHGVLFLVFVLVVVEPAGPVGASAAEVTAFYSSSGQRRVMIAGLYLMPFAGIAFIWFIVALRMWVAGTARRGQHPAVERPTRRWDPVIRVAVRRRAASTSVLAASVEFSHG